MLHVVCPGRRHVRSAQAYNNGLEPLLRKLRSAVLSPSPSCCRAPIEGESLTVLNCCGTDYSTVPIVRTPTPWGTSTCSPRDRVLWKSFTLYVVYPAVLHSSAGYEVHTVCAEIYLCSSQGITSNPRHGTRSAPRRVKAPDSCERSALEAQQHTTTYKRKGSDRRESC